LLEAEGELKRVSRPVSTHLEMTEIQTRLLNTGGPAVLFENPVHEDGRPSEMPALVNPVRHGGPRRPRRDPGRRAAQDRV
jgi:4-hydroxy-3-polyprenylbenzoate decarboxylase